MSKPMYLHGLEAKPWGTKGAWMTRTYGGSGPELPSATGEPDAFAKSCAVARDAVAREQPSLIVGSSFGGAVLMQLQLDGVWAGPSVFLAQAAIRLGVCDASGRVPDGVSAIFIHARADDVVPFADSQAITDNSGPLVQLWPTHGDHRLHHITEDGTLQRAVDELLPR